MRQYTHPAGLTLELFRNERNFRARRPQIGPSCRETAWHEARNANVNQRDDPTWISSFPRVATIHSKIIGTKQEEIHLFDHFLQSAALAP
ncbi:MAG: hypothetical protein F4213_15715 [Boseongicola sp. SB0677_bin_26]|nr:hypothetical protein [Boseongicola sp. SB0677_bin_26]